MLETLIQKYIHSMPIRISYLFLLEFIPHIYCLHQVLDNLVHYGQEFAFLIIRNFPIYFLSYLFSGLNFLLRLEVEFLH